MKSDNILVTGGAGYIGSHVCKALAQSGYTPVVYDNLIYGHEWAVKWGVLEVGDIASGDRLKQVLDKYRPAAIVHFAAFAYVGESVTQPLKYYNNNVSGTLNLLNAMLDSGIDKIVFSSSCATYGNPIAVPITEDHPQHPINPYGRSKLMVEKILVDVGDAHGLQSVALRYFNAAGADPEGEIGECHDPETHLIPLVLDVAAGKRSHITVFGDDYPTRDGTCIRDYIHVTDLARAHVLALQKLLRPEPRGRQSAGGGAPGRDAFPAGNSAVPGHYRAFNLGNGLGFSVKEVIAAAERVTGKAIAVKMGKRRPGDPPVLIGDAKKAVTELGWKPEHADLEQIISTAWQWHKKFQGRRD